MTKNITSVFYIAKLNDEDRFLFRGTPVKRENSFFFQKAWKWYFGVKNFEKMLFHTENRMC